MGVSSAPSSSPASKIDELIGMHVGGQGPGCAIGVLVEGELVFAKGYGLANLEYCVPIGVNTPFHAASLSKQFTAFAIHLLESKGLLSLDDSITRYFEGMPDFMGTITLRHLLHHTSGLRDQWELLGLAGWRMEDVIGSDDIIGLVKMQRGLNFAPGGEFQYCSTGYTLLAAIVEALAGGSFRVFCDTRVFGPLGMARTHFHDDIAEIEVDRAYSYLPAGEDSFKLAPMSFSTVGATGLFTTIGDLALWEGEFHSRRVFGEGIFERMLVQGSLTSGERVAYGSGLVLGEYKGRQSVRHTGSDAGYRCAMFRLPSEGLAVFLLGNLGSLNPGPIVEGIADLFIGAGTERAVEPEAASPAMNLPEDRLAALASLYYSKGSATIRRLDMRDGRLFLMVGAGLELEAVAPDELRIVGRPFARFSFGHSPETGRLMMVERIGNPMPVTYEAVERTNPSKEELREYEGDFFSVELEAFYRISSEEGMLTLRRRKFRAMRLDPAFRDAFMAEATPTLPSFVIIFERSEYSRILGFKLTTRDVRDIRFEKLRPEA